jgi:hypothetical protein
MLPYYPAHDGYPSMFEADVDAVLLWSDGTAPAVFISTYKPTSGAANRERLRSALPKHCHSRSQAETRIAEESAIPRNSTVRSGWFAGRTCEEDVLLLQISQQTGGVMRKLIVLTAVTVPNHADSCCDD